MRRWSADIRCGDDGAVRERIRAIVDAEWEHRLGVENDVLRDGGLHVVAAELGDNDAMSFLLDETCIVVVPEEGVDAAKAALVGLKPAEAFTANLLRRLTGFEAQIDGPSWHAYVDGRGRGLAVRPVATMVAAALPAVEVVRYRALASNVASLAVARRLGFEPYGQNFRARRRSTTS